MIPASQENPNSLPYNSNDAIKGEGAQGCAQRQLRHVHEFPSSIPSRQKQASSAYSEMEAAFRKMSKYGDVYSNMEKAMERYSNTNAELAEKKARISFLEQHQQQSIEDHEKRATHLKMEIANLEDKLAKTKAEAIMLRNVAAAKQKAEEEIVILRKEQEAQKPKITNLIQELERITAKAACAQQAFEHCKSQLNKWESKLSLLWDTDIQALLVVPKDFLSCVCSS